MDNTIEKRIQSLNDRLSYTRDIFAGKHEDSIRLLDEKLTEFTNRVRNGEVEDPHTEIVSLEDLFVFVEKRLEAHHAHGPRAHRAPSPAHLPA